MRALRLALLIALVLGFTAGVDAAETKKVKVGILKLTSSAPVFVGVENPR
jgi:ABC-type nitrate/sulfonate/bicarbonate transport system substrate-binding protein